MEKIQDELVVAGIGSKGYGLAYKLLMQDIRLSPEAKCIYNYFASYAGAGSSAFPRVETILYHLRLGKDRYYDHFKLLTHYGYIRVEHEKAKGKFYKNIYHLEPEVKMPVKPVPYRRGDEKKMKKTEEKKVEKTEEILPTPCNGDTDEPIPCNQDTGNPDTEDQDSNSNKSLKVTNYNNNNINNNNLNTNQSINHSEEQEIDGKSDLELDNLISQMEIDYLSEEQAIKDAVKTAIATLYYTEGALRTQDTTYYPQAIRRALQELRIWHIEYAIKRYIESSKKTPITNHLKYMMVVILTAKATMEFENIAHNH